MRLSSYVPSFYFYKLAEAISGPYTSLMAYQSGAIDQNGNILKPESSIDSFEYLVIKLKKIFEQLPYGTTKAKLGNYMSTLQLFGEHAEQFDIPQEQYHCLIEGILTQNTQGELSYLELLEDMSVGAGGGAPGSLGTPTQASNQGGIAGFDPKMGMPLLRRKPPKYFDNCEVFDVCPEEFMQFKAAKQWTDVPDSETKNYLQRFQRRNKSGKMAVKSLNPLNGETELHWINYPAKNFIEDIDFGDLNFLFENFVSGMTSIGRKTMITMSVPTISERSGKEQENAKMLLGDIQAPGTIDPKSKTRNVDNENYLLTSIRKRLEGAKYKFKESAKSKKDIGIGEFGIFKEGGDAVNSDIFVGVEHPTEKGQVHHIGIESGYNKKLQKQYLIPRGTRVTVPKDVEDMTGGRIKGEIDIGKSLVDYGKLSSTGSRYSLWPVISSVFKRNPRKTKSRFAKMAHDAIRKKSDDISILGHEGRISVVHHRKQDSIERQASQKLLDDLTLHHTHDLDELGFSKSPFYGGSTPKKT